MSTAAAHVPAWKRVGLKLKSADERNPQQVTPQLRSPPADIDLHPRSTNRKRSRDELPETQASKRPRSIDTNAGFTSDEPIQSANDRFINSVYKGRPSIANTKTPQKIVFNENDSTVAETPLNKSLSRKKSVTFTPETKAEDGQSGQDFAKAWLQKPDQSIDPQDISSALDTPSKAVSVESTLQNSDDISVKKKKRAKVKTAAQEAAVDSVARSACIAYLQQYHTDRANWKFNKSRQNHLLRHIWNLSEIPSDLDEAIVEYISGLQGKDSRQRLYNGAIIFLDKFVEKHFEDLSTVSMDTAEARKAAYDQALEKQLTLIAEFGTNEDEDEILATLRQEKERAERASKLLWKVLWQDLHPDKPDPYETSAQIKPTSTATGRKARKVRTAAAEVSDSSDSDTTSSEESSDDDSDSDSDSGSDSTSELDSAGDSDSSLGEN